jgi:hypothetical protein
VPSPDRIADGLDLADHALDLGLRIAELAGLLNPAQRAARLRARAERIRGRAKSAKPRKRDRLLGRASGLDLRADALAPAPKDPTP